MGQGCAVLLADDGPVAQAGRGAAGGRDREALARGAAQERRLARRGDGLCGKAGHVHPAGGGEPTERSQEGQSGRGRSGIPERRSPGEGDDRGGRGRGKGPLPRDTGARQDRRQDRHGRDGLPDDQGDAAAGRGGIPDRQANLPGGTQVGRDGARKELRARHRGRAVLLRRHPGHGKVGHGDGPRQPVHRQAHAR